jgi:hypothetical protein
MKWAWAISLTGMVLGEMLFSCRGALHPLVRVFLESAGLEQMCARDQKRP